MCVCVCVRARVPVLVCVCARERQCSFVYMCARTRVRVCKYVCVHVIVLLSSHFICCLCSFVMCNRKRKRNNIFLYHNKIYWGPPHHTRLYALDLFLSSRNPASNERALVFQSFDASRLSVHNYCSCYFSIRGCMTREAVLRRGNKLH